MREILSWLKPGTRIKRYILLQILSLATFVYCTINLMTIDEMSEEKLYAYIGIVIVALFFIVYSFLIAQKRILTLTLKNLASKSKTTEIKNLLYADPSRKKGPKIVVIGGGSGLSNILKSLKEYTSNITTVIDVSESEELNNDYTKNAKITPGDIRKCIAALSISEDMVEEVLTNRVTSGIRKSHSIGSLLISSMITVTGSFQKALYSIPEFFNIEGQILPTTMEETSLCASLENGEIVVGKNNISSRIEEISSPIKQVFLKDGSIKLNPKVLDSIKHANMIVLGPGTLYTTVISNLLISDLSKAIVKSKAKKVFIANLMNAEGETKGYTLSKHVNELERYLGRPVLDYVIANNGDITEEMAKDFNQTDSKPVKVDIENIKNRGICVLLEDLVMTAPSSIIHNSKRVAEMLFNISKSKRIGKLNIVKIKKKHMQKERFFKSKFFNKIKDLKLKRKESNNNKKNIKSKKKVDLKSKKIEKKIMSKINSNLKG